MPQTHHRQMNSTSELLCRKKKVCELLNECYLKLKSMAPTYTRGCNNAKTMHNTAAVYKVLPQHPAFHECKYNQAGASQCEG